MAKGLWGPPISSAGARTEDRAAKMALTAGRQPAHTEGIKVPLCLSKCVCWPARGFVILQGTARSMKAGTVPALLPGVPG